MAKTTQALQYARGLLDALIQFDKEVQAAYYEMGRILHSFKEDKLYNLLGYTSLAELIEEELSFSQSTAYGYVRLYRTMNSLGYKKEEAIDFINKFGMGHCVDVLAKERRKLGVRAMRTRVESLDRKQITFWMTKTEADELRAALEKVGGIYDEESGRWKNASEAIIEMARMINARGRREAA